MSSNTELIYNYLSADATLIGSLGMSGYSGILQGGMYTRPIKLTGFGATPNAFYESDKGRILRPSAVILDRGDNEHSQADAIYTAYDSFPLIYFYAPANETGKTRIRDAQNRVFDLLHDWSFVTEDGPVAFVRYVDRVGLVDSEEFVGVVFDYCRYHIVSRKRSLV